MKIKLNATYKSLEPFESEIPNFCVITGKNGSGKTQLIELIQAKHGNTNANFELDINRLKIQIEGMNHPSTNSLDPSGWNGKINEFHSDYTSNLHFFAALEVLYKNIPDFSLQKIDKKELKDQLQKLASEELKKGMNSIRYFEPGIPPEHYATMAAETIVQKRVSFDIAWMVAQKSRKRLEAISYQDFLKFPPDEKYIDRQHLFYSSIDRIFYSYAKRRHLNFMQDISNREFKREYECSSDAEFIEKYPPPWETANDIFDKHQINYAFEDVPPDAFVENIPLEFKLIKKSSKKRIEFVNLSSGEKIIIALIVKLFTSDFYKKSLELPELIVLDEPDAHLHPQLAKLLIDVLNDTFVNELGIKVIVTTHSPSTVAMSPEDSIFELKNEYETSLRKITKDEALKILTFGVPTLSIDFRNHRQVFVESPTDAFYYQSVYGVLSQNEKLVFKPYFVSYGKGKGNCDQVIELVKNLRTAGNEKVFGIVDWDGKRDCNIPTYVHGYKINYSVENFIYYPVYLVAYFLEIGGAEKVTSELSFDENYNQYTLGYETNERLQSISDWVISRFSAKFSAYPQTNTPTTEVKYFNGVKINLPKWYCEMKGHELEEKLKQIFPSLEGKFRNEGQMQEQITKIIAKSYPFVPMDTVLLLRQLTK